MTARFAMADASDDGGGFDLLLGDRVIVRHRVDAPAFRISIGVADVLMVRGNFKLTSVDGSEEAPLHPVVADDQVHLSLTAGGPALLTLTLAPIATGTRLAIRCTDPAFNRLSFDLCAVPGEHVWGGGEQMSYLSLTGRVFPMWTSEPGVGRDKSTELTRLMDADGMAGGDYWTTNYPQPTFLSSAGYACHLDTGVFSVLDFTDHERHQIDLWAASTSVEFMTAPSLSELVDTMSDRFGRQHPLPEWAIGGAIVGLKDGANSFARLERIIAAGAAVSGLWCEDWVGVRQTSFGRRLFWDWQWNAARYPDLPAKIAALKARGIRFLGYVNPYLAVDGPQYAEAARRGYLARRLDSEAPYAVDFGEFDAGVVDFTNADAAAWFAEEIIGKQMLDVGLDGWMADFGEYLPVDLRLHDGNPMEQHNRWPVHWAKVNADAVAARGKTGDVVWFMRAGYSGVQRYCPLLWAGDQSVDFSRHDGIGTVITAALSAGLVGNAYSHSDVGGYTSLHGNVRTAELMHRWFELGAFTPVMRTHEGNRPDDNLQIDSTPELLADFARWTRVHAALAPYVRHLCNEARASGLPLQRALFLHYPNDRATFSVQDQYLYGADLMVAPVIAEGATARTVLLPGTRPWVHVWTGVSVPPGEHHLDAPLGEPPIFYRADSRFAALFASLPLVRDGLA